MGVACCAQKHPTDGPPQTQERPNCVGIYFSFYYNVCSDPTEAESPLPSVPTFTTHRGHGAVYRLATFIRFGSAQDQFQGVSERAQVRGPREKKCAPVRYYMFFWIRKPGSPLSRLLSDLPTPSPASGSRRFLCPWPYFWCVPRKSGGREKGTSSSSVKRHGGVSSTLAGQRTAFTFGG